MKLHGGAFVLSAIFLLTFSKATNSQFMCYVCENCPEITMDIPMVECNANYFNTGGTTMSSIMTTTPMDPTTAAPETTPMSKTEAQTTPTTTTTAMETTEMTTEEDPETTTFETTDAPTSTATPPTPPTVGPAATTEAIPTPPAPGTTPRIIEVISFNKTSSLNDTNAYALLNPTVVAIAPTTATNDSTAGASKVYMPSTDFRVRQVRSIVDTDVTYHCYTIQKNVNGSVYVDRGCSRVTTQEAVCEQLQQMNNNTINKCTPCSLTMCNGSAALSASIITLLLASVAALLYH